MELHLVDQSTDDKPTTGLLEPELGNVMRALVDVRNSHADLVALLAKKGLITTEDKGNLENQPQEAKRAGLAELCRVDDLDDLEWL